jgi:superfamily II DNA or RNA helicase
VRRFFSQRQRSILALLTGGKCAACGKRLTKGDYHADHVHPFSKGGTTTTDNGAALCATCNLKKGSRMKDRRPRAWQKEALNKAITYYRIGGRNFLIDAAPGAGKTHAAALIAQEMLAADMVDRVVVIAPRKKIVTQWANLFRNFTGREMMKVTGKVMEYFDPAHMQADVCATWAGIQTMNDHLQAVCRHSNVLVIGDEVHHAALGAVWGDGTNHAFDEARAVLALTGTPVRSDGREALWLTDSIEVSAEQSHVVSYREAIDEGWCVPVFLHCHAGSIDVGVGRAIVSVKDTGTVYPAGLKDNLTPGLRRKLRFDKVIYQPQYEADGKTPRVESYHASMLQEANAKLDDLRMRKYGEYGLPNAGALVIAPSIQMANYFKALIELLWPDEHVDIVHSDMGEAAEHILDSYTKRDNKWIVSVNMISEGVDIPRLRVMVFLPQGRTELFFRQAIGRIIRKDDKLNGKKIDPDKDNSRAYCVMPAVSSQLTGVDSFIEYAKRLESEMPVLPSPPPVICPNCSAELKTHPRAGSPCPHCGYEPPPPPPDQWTCSPWSGEGCGTINIGGKHCHHCGMPRQQPITVEDAIGYRKGGIGREEEITEEEVQASEELIDNGFLEDLIRPENAKVARLLRGLPEEAHSIVERFYNRHRGNQQ